MTILKFLVYIFCIIAFVSGLYFYAVVPASGKEGLTNKRGQERPDPNATQCADLLVRKGNIFLLYNSNIPAKDGENPLPFYSLDEYIAYLETQRKQGFDCPVLYLQMENDAQGNDVYRIRPSPFQQEGGNPQHIDPALFPDGVKLFAGGHPINIVDANRDSGYNTGTFQGFDPYGLHVGEYTVLDAVHESTANQPVSDNPMDTNWGGIRVTEGAVNSGKYEDRYVARPILFTPKTNYIPGQGQLPPNELPDFLKPRLG